MNVRYWGGQADMARTCQYVKGIAAALQISEIHFEAILEGAGRPSVVDGDGTITADEFKTPRGKGLVKSTKP